MTKLGRGSLAACILAVLIGLCVVSSLPSTKAASEVLQVQWSQTYPTPQFGGIDSVIQTIDGGYALAGWQLSWVPPAENYSGFWLAKVDSNGQMEWEHTYLGYGIANSLINTNDGGYLLAGTSAADIATGIIVKTDSSGKLEWNLTYDGPIYCVIQTREGGYTFSGYLWGSSRTLFWLFNTDASGNIQWSQT